MLRKKSSVKSGQGYRRARSQSIKSGEQQQQQEQQEIIKNSTPLPQEEDILSDDDDDDEPSTIFVSRNSKSASAQLSSNHHRQPRSYSNETSTLKIPLFEHILLNSSSTNESNINNNQANSISNSNAAASSSRSRSSTFSSSSHESLNEITKNANDDKNNSLLLLGKGVFLQNVIGSILKPIGPLKVFISQRF